LFVMLLKTLFSKSFAKICFLFFPAIPTIKKIKEKRNTLKGLNN